MPWFKVEIEVDSDIVRTYGVSAPTEEDAAFTARDWFDDLVSVRSAPLPGRKIEEAEYDSILISHPHLSEPDVKGVGRRRK